MRAREQDFLASEPRLPDNVAFLFFREFSLTALINSVLVLAPIVLMLAIGYALALAKIITREHAQGLGKLAYWVCLPALICQEVSRSDPRQLFDGRLIVGLNVVLVATLILAYRYARWRRAPEAQVGVIAQAAFRSNMMYVGLSVLIFYFQSKVSGDVALELARKRGLALAAVTTAISMPALNAGSILCFLLPRRHRAEHRVSTARIIWMTLSNPLLVAMFAGVGLGLCAPVREYFGPTAVLGRTLDMAGVAALPVALLSVGAILDPAQAFTNWRQSAPVVAIKWLLVPAAGLLLLYALGLHGDTLSTGVILLGCPTAAASYPVALEMGGDEIFAGELIAVTTCPVTLIVWLRACWTS